MERFRNAKRSTLLPCHVSKITQNDIFELTHLLSGPLERSAIPEGVIVGKSYSDTSMTFLALQMITDELYSAPAFELRMQQAMSSPHSVVRQQMFEQMIGECEQSLAADFYKSLEHFRGMPDRDRRISLAKSVSHVSKLDKAQGHLKSIWQEVHGDMCYITRAAKRMDILKRVRRMFGMNEQAFDLSDGLREFQQINNSIAAEQQVPWEDLEQQGVAVLHLGQGS